MLAIGCKSILGIRNGSSKETCGHQTLQHACVLTCFSPVQLFATLWTVARQVLLTMEFSRQGYWSGVPCVSPRDLSSPPRDQTCTSCLLHCQASSLPLAPPAAAAAARSLQSFPTVRPHRRQPTRFPRPWDFPDKSTGVGCHCLLQCHLGSPKHSGMLREGLMLKLKLQYFGHLMQRTDSSEKNLMLGKIEDGKRRG